MSPGLGLPSAPGYQPADLLLSFAVGSVRWAWGPWVLACAADDGGHGLRGACLQGASPRVVGEGDLPGPQVADHVLFAGRARGVGSAAGAPSSAPGGGFRSGQQDVQGGQVRQDAVLADVLVLRPFRVQRGSAGSRRSALAGMSAHVLETLRIAGLRDSCQEDRGG